jgi:hypothetical protein
LKSIPLSSDQGKLGVRLRGGLSAGKGGAGPGKGAGYNGEGFVVNLVFGAVGLLVRFQVRSLKKTKAAVTTTTTAIIATTQKLVLRERQVRQ